VAAVVPRTSPERPSTVLTASMVELDRVELDVAGPWRDHADGQLGPPGDPPRRRIDVEDQPDVLDVDDPVAGPVGVAVRQGELAAHGAQGSRLFVARARRGRGGSPRSGRPSCRRPPRPDHSVVGCAAMAVDDLRSGTWVTYIGGKASSVRVRRCRIEITAGPDSGLVRDIEAPVIRIGARRGNDVQISDSKVSGLHAEIRLDDRGYRLRDLDSTNGTFVSGMRIVDLYIQPGTQIAVGGTRA
jgi:hypothetical protein